MEEYKKRLYKISEIIRILLWGVFILSIVLPLLKIISPVFFPIISLILGLYIFIAAIYFKKTLGTRGVLAGEKNYAYVYESFFQLWFFSGIFCYVLFLGLGMNKTLFFSIGISALIVGYITIYLITKYILKK